MFACAPGLACAINFESIYRHRHAERAGKYTSAHSPALCLLLGLPEMKQYLLLALVERKRDHVKSCTLTANIHIHLGTDLGEFALH